MASLRKVARISNTSPRSSFFKLPIRISLFFAVPEDERMYVAVFPPITGFVS